MDTFNPDHTFQGISVVQGDQPGQAVAPIQSYNNSAIAKGEQAAALVKARFTLALARPRDTMVARTRILNECKRPGFAHVARWNKPRGGKTISGFSIRFAEAAIRAWGNVDVKAEVSYEDSDVRKLEISVLDLETNASYSKEITVEKVVERKKTSPGQRVLGQRLNSYGETVFLVEATEDDMAVKEGAAISKVIRTLGLRMIPGDILEEAEQQVYQTIESGVKQDPQAALKRMVDAFAKWGVTPEQLVEYLGHKIEATGSAEGAELAGVLNAVREGAKFVDILAEKRGTKAEAQPAAEPAKTKPTPKKRTVEDIVPDERKPETVPAPEPPASWTKAFNDTTALLKSSDPATVKIAHAIMGDTLKRHGKKYHAELPEDVLVDFIMQVDVRLSEME